MKKIIILVLLFASTWVAAQNSLFYAYANHSPQIDIPPLNKFEVGKGLKMEEIGNKIKITYDPPFTLTKEQILQLASTSPQAKEYLKTIYPELLKEVVDLSTARATGVATIGISGGMGRLVLVQAQNNGVNLYGGKSLLVGAAFTAEVIQDGKDQLIIFKRKD